MVPDRAQFKGTFTMFPTGHEEGPSADQGEWKMRRKAQVDGDSSFPDHLLRGPKSGAGRDAPHMRDTSGRPHLRASGGKYGGF